MSGLEWDAIPYDQIIFTGEKLGAGSFGVVLKGVYLGIEVAVKEVLPSKDYEVSKYFEREWRIMKEARHPNIVLYLGLSRGPPPESKIYIISEYVENGNLRSYIWDTRTHPTFPWRLRLSFATDIARALSYLHARKCMHRDLKGENLLLTANERVKMTDFGFARIAARNEEEMRRISFCGTDGYMSPEILTGAEFDLPTDVFSLGIIFCEIISRKLVDSHTFQRSVPSFGLDPTEVQNLASPGCPPAFISLALDCVLVDPGFRPKMDEVLRRLRDIEIEVLARESSAEHVGSLKLISPSNRPGLGKRIPSFGQGIGKDIGGGGGGKNKKVEDSSGDESDDNDLKEILSGLGTIRLGGGKKLEGGEDLKDMGGSTWRTAKWDQDGEGEEKSGRRSLLSLYENASEMRGHQHLLSEATTYAPSAGVPSSFTDYSTTVVRARPSPTSGTLPAAEDEAGASSVLTIKNHRPVDPSVAGSLGGFPEIPSELPSDSPAASPPPPPASGKENKAEQPKEVVVQAKEKEKKEVVAIVEDPLSTSNPSIIAPRPSPAAPTRPPPPLPESSLTHRFTFVKPVNGNKMGGVGGVGLIGLGWFSAGNSNSSGLGDGKGKCRVCARRVKTSAPCLVCDDCSSVVHIKCSANAPRDCGKTPSPNGSRAATSSSSKPKGGLAGR